MWLHRNRDFIPILFEMLKWGAEGGFELLGNKLVASQ